MHRALAIIESGIRNARQAHPGLIKEGNGHVADVVELADFVATVFDKLEVVLTALVQQSTVALCVPRQHLSPFLVAAREQTHVLPSARPVGERLTQSAVAADHKDEEGEQEEVPVSSSIPVDKEKSTGYKRTRRCRRPIPARWRRKYRA